MDLLIAAERLSKAFGPTIAVNAISCSIQRGKVTALLGGNGAGKSTLVRLITGEVRSDAGKLLFDGQEVDLGTYSVLEAKRSGIRVVHQELSICTNLSVEENCYLELSSLFTSGNWRKKAAGIMRETLAAIFPDYGFALARHLGDLTLAQQQMVEIARAAADPGLKLLILDEPTSSLDAARSEQLFSYLRRRTSQGLSVVFISHKLSELLDLAEDFLVMRDGNLVWAGLREKISLDRLVTLMSAETVLSQKEEKPQGARKEAGSLLLEISGRWQEGKSSAPIQLAEGEIVGLSGLEGSGQQELLFDIYRATPKGKGDVRRSAPAAYVAGDRAKEGVFPAWSTLRNMTVARNARRHALAPVRLQPEQSWSEPWRDRFNFSKSALERPILQLSGGNQQKALMSRALIDQAKVILLNDPTRGVDVGVKREFYQVLRDIAAAGKLVVWYSSEDSEFLECSRILVLQEGKVKAQLAGEEASRENLVAAFFAKTDQASLGSKKVVASGNRHLPGWLIPLVALVAVLLTTGLYNPRALSPFGLGLLLSTALPLVLVSLGQMFVVGRSEIDLGIGAFAGLINVISATLLVENPLLGVGALAVGLAAYGLLGWLIHARQIPAIVATLGSAFIWTGVGYVLQPAPGGSSPPWLTTLFNVPIPYLPVPIWMLLAASVAAILVTMSRLGVVQRGFGNNAFAMRQLGWPAARSHVVTYLLSAIFGLGAGLCLTGVNTASDINAASSYTLLSVAAVVMGGCELVGGRIEPLGVVFAAVTLSLLGTLLGFMRLSSDNIAAVQGLILILAVLLRTAWKKPL